MVVACGSGRGVFGWGGGDAGVGEVEDVGARVGSGGCRRRRGADDAGAMELAESAVHCVLGEEREPFGDLSDTRLHDELVVALLGVVDESWRMTMAWGPCCWTNGNDCGYRCSMRISVAAGDAVASAPEPGVTSPSHSLRNG